MHVSIPFVRVAGAIAVTGARIVALGPLVARADLWINIKSPTCVSGVNTACRLARNITSHTQMMPSAEANRNRSVPAVFSVALIS